MFQRSLEVPVVEGISHRRRDASGDILLLALQGRAYGCDKLAEFNLLKRSIFTNGSRDINYLRFLNRELSLRLTFVFQPRILCGIFHALQHVLDPRQHTSIN